MYRASHCFTALMVMAMTSSAFAAGYYNMPTSLQQCLGLGYGPGYHAPLMLERSYKATTASQRVQRMPAPLRPSQACAFGTASSCASSCGGGRCSGGAAGIYHGASNGYVPAIEAPAIKTSVVEAPVIERVAPSFAPPTLIVPQQVTVPPYPMQPMYPVQHGFPTQHGLQVPSTMGPGPVFPSAQATQKPMLLW